MLQEAQRVARGTFDGSETQLAKDLCRAWQCNIETTRRAGGGDLAAWVDLTNGDITGLRQMPDKA